MDNYNQLQLREIFHLEFLRWLGRKLKADNYSLKGGANLRLFFNSFRYSEDMDLDISDVRVDVLKEVVMNILKATTFQDILKPFGVQKIIVPDMSKAKQTETTQRFKIHLLTSNAEDLFTKIEFSRRGFKGKVVVGAASEFILRQYKMVPLLVAHYDITSATMQKILALATRKTIQARDIFDIFVLSSQYADFASNENRKPGHFAKSDFDKFKKAQENVFEISYEQFRDTVLSYLSPQDQEAYKTKSSWDEVKLKAVHFIDELRKNYA